MKRYLTYAVAILLVASTSYFAIKYNIAKYENQKNQEISELKIQHLMELNEKSNQ